MYLSRKDILLKCKDEGLTLVFHADIAFVEGGVSAGLHHLNVRDGEREDVRFREGADVEESSLLCSLDGHVAALGSATS